MILKFLQHLAGLKNCFQTAVSLKGTLPVIPTTSGLCTARRTDLVRCADLQRQAIAAVILCDHFRFVAVTSSSMHTDRIGFRAAMSFLCCLARSSTAHLSIILLETAFLFFKRRRGKRLLPVAPDQYSRQRTSKPVLFAKKRAVSYDYLSASGTGTVCSTE